ncbi:MAG: hypothetical protein V3S25_09430 [Nitrospirales bacterium]
MLLAFLLFAVCGAAPIWASGMLEIAELVSAPAQYDQQKVAVVGHVSNLTTAKNRKGQTFYGFLLKDTDGTVDGTVKVLGPGKAPVREGEYIMVEGIFRRLRQFGRVARYNEIKPTLIRTLARLHPDLVG